MDSGRLFEELAAQRLNEPGVLPETLGATVEGKRVRVSTHGAVVVPTGDILVPGGQIRQRGGVTNVSYWSDYLVVVPATEYGGMPALAWADAKLSLGTAKYNQITRWGFVWLWPLTEYWRAVAVRLVAECPEVANAAELLGVGDEPSDSLVLLKGFVVCPDTPENRAYLDSELNQRRHHPLQEDEVLFLL